ncbi:MULTISPECIES: DUF3105 domain-containing protein [Nocardia]|uniref:Uncharacterized protein DUF3105 n=2 Tax=Nocardia TaxID=1817 RepID=A0A4R6PSJ4_NOCIG|nr:MULTISPECIES: DUF3105 domain-containing protein [Nocardia]NKX90743.1 DUF3105 domain-containing protein [Nocardia coubleae]TDP40042.1 uncharacterized protein DUF3105 [Nocardia ignorata]
MPSRTSATSAKAVRAAGKSSPSRKPGKGKLPHKKREVPWGLLGGGVVIVALIGLLAYSIVPKYMDQAAIREAQTDLSEWAPSEQNQDPAAKIEGVVKQEYPAALHVTETQRVAYDKSPAYGGPHDVAWANCTGTVYAKPIRMENAVHSLEHGAVWITYNPDKVDAAGVEKLSNFVKDRPYTMMSPYPALDTPIALQSWGHQLKLDSAEDARIKQFISALRTNPYAHPEVGASCSNPIFDANNPPPFDSSPYGPDAIPMDGTGANQDASELGGLGSGVPGLPGIPMPGAPAGQ